MGGVRGLVGMLHHGRLGGVTPGRSAVGCGVDGAHRQVDRLQECQAEVIGLLEKLNAGGVTLILITHDVALGSRAQRHIVTLDGRVQSDSAA